MIKSDEDECPSFSSSNASGTCLDNHKNIDKVSKLFSNLFKNTEVAYTGNFSRKILNSSEEKTKGHNFNCKTATLSKENTNEQLVTDSATLQKENTNPSNVPFEEESKRTKPSTPKDTCDVNDQTLTTPKTRSPPKENQSLAVSATTIVFDEPKTLCTPTRSKIPIFRSRSEEIQRTTYDDDSRSSLSLKYVQYGSLRRICSNTKIPVSTKRQYPEITPPNRYQQSGLSIYDNDYRNQQTSNQGCGEFDRNVSRKYRNVKSKLAAYIHRPIKTEAFRMNNNRSPISPRGRRMRYDSYTACSTVRRSNSRTSLDTYVCDKTPATDLGFVHYEKFDEFCEPVERLRKYIVLAAEYRRMQMEKQRVILDYQRSIIKEQQSVIEHNEKANELMEKAIALLTSRMVDKS